MTRGGAGGVYPDPDRPRRFGPLDALLVALVLLGAAQLWVRVDDVLAYRWDWSFLPRAFVTRDPATGALAPNLLLEGLLVTLRVSLWAMALATALGLALGIMATQPRLLPRLVAAAYVGVVRNMPPLVFVFVFYFFLSAQLAPLLGLQDWARSLSPAGSAAVAVALGPPALVENLVWGVLCLALFEAAYVCEIVRAGLAAVPREQREAALSLGMRPGLALRLVVLPQALRAVTPPLANQFIMLVKNSALVSLISVQELTFLGAELAVSTDRRFETWIAVAALYFVLCFGLSRLFARLERRGRARDAR